MVSAEIRPGTTFSVGEQRRLFSFAPFVRAGSSVVRRSPDDHRFLMVREGDASQQSELVLAEHWAQELMVRAPR